MNIDGLTIGQAKEIAAMFVRDGNPVSPYDGLIGGEVMVRTVTMIYVGKLVAIYPQELVLSDASWIPETGRGAQFVKDGEISECEPYPNGMDVIVGRGAVLDACRWQSALPREQK